MSDHPANRTRSRAWIVPMRARSPDEPHRGATPLELFFDLVFVVAVAQAASSLHHGIADNHAFAILVRYAMVFTVIWWAWMNFTWFASAYDTDDVLYRLTTFVQLTGALLLAAGVPRAFEEQDVRLVIGGYVVMRLAMVTQWLRAARSDPPRRSTAYRYAVGISAVQAAWVGLAFMPAARWWIGFLVLAVLELAIPVWAERVAPTPWHPEHLVERYGLFTIIMLGESILSAALALQSAVQPGTFNATVGAMCIGALLIVLSMWWLYFDWPRHDINTSMRTAFLWGYGHLLIFGAAAAVGAGIAVAVDWATGHADIGAVGAGAAVAVPVALYLFGLWALQYPGQTAQHGLEAWLLPSGAVLVLVSVLTGQAVLVTGLLLAGMLAVKLVRLHAVASRTAVQQDTGGMHGDCVGRVERTSWQPTDRT